MKVQQFLIFSLVLILVGCGGNGGNGNPNPIPEIPSLDDTIPDTPDQNIPEENPVFTAHFNTDVTHLATFQNCEVQPVVAGPMAYGIETEINDNGLGGDELKQWCLQVNKSNLLDVASKTTTDVINSGKLYEADYTVDGDVKKVLAYDIPMTFAYDPANTVIGSTLFIIKHAREGLVQEAILDVRIQNPNTAEISVMSFKLVETLITNQEKALPVDPTYLPILSVDALVLAEKCTVQSSGDKYDWSATMSVTMPNDLLVDPSASGFGWWHSGIEIDLKNRPIAGDLQNLAWDAALTYFGSPVEGGLVALKYVLSDDFNVIPLSGTKFKMFHDGMNFIVTTGPGGTYKIFDVVVIAEINGAGGFSDFTLTGKIIDETFPGAVAANINMECTP
ncbi:MAG TPA: hypothetical protein DCL21_00735 [Alphaproteobacteria bacterium]|nr:hypothetical protein [Alphaproteobacteria bacterium]